MDFSINARAEDIPVNAVARNTIALDTITMGYDDVGDGDPVVLIHGHPFDRSMWGPQIAEFAGAGWRVIAPDLRGYGESSVTPGVTGFADFAEDIAALLDHLGLDRVVLGGLSMGGQIAMEFYRLFPERVRGLLLSDTFPRAESPEGKVFRRSVADRLLAEGMAAYAEEVLDKMIAPYNVTGLPAVAAHVRRMMTATPPQGAAAAIRARAERPDYRLLLTEVVVPALVVVGADDEYTPVTDAEFMHAQLPDSTLAVIAGAAHMPNLERPAEFNEAMRRFLTSVSRQADIATSVTRQRATS